MRIPGEDSETEQALRHLARLAHRAVAHDGLVERFGRVHASAPDSVTVKGLSHWLSPGDLVQVGPSSGVVMGVSRDAADIALNRLPRFAEEVALFASPDVEADETWLGRVLDASLSPLDGGAPPRDAAPPASVRPDVANPTTTWRTGIAAVDLVMPILRGELWTVEGSTIRSRSSALATIHRNGEHHAVIVVQVDGRRQDDAPTSDDRSTIRIRCSSKSGETARAVANASQLARSLIARGMETVLLVDGLATLDTDLASVLRRQSEGIRPTTLIACKDRPSELAVDGTLVLAQDHGCIDLAETLRRGPDAPDELTERISLAILEWAENGALNHPASPLIQELRRLDGRGGSISQDDLLSALESVRTGAGPRRA